MADFKVKGMQTTIGVEGCGVDVLIEPGVQKDSVAHAIALGATSLARQESGLEKSLTANASNYDRTTVIALVGLHPRRCPDRDKKKHERELKDKTALFVVNAMKELGLPAVSA